MFLLIGYILNAKENLLEFLIKNIRNAIKSYINSCIPNSSKVKLLLSNYNRRHFSERLARSKCVLPSVLKSQNLYLSVVRLRTFKHKKSPLFSMYLDGRMLKVLKDCQVQTYHISRRVLSLSGDIEENPAPLHQYSANNVPDVNSHSLLDKRLFTLNRIALDVGGGGDCFFRAVSHQLYGNPDNHIYMRNLCIQYLV